MTIPYTYRITHLPSGKHYYGARYAKDCHPSDLWIKYFTSSKVVKRLIEQDGKDAFFVEVRKVFDDVISCKKWEESVLRRLRILSNDKWLNVGMQGTHQSIYGKRGFVVVKDSDGKIGYVGIDDPKYLSGELKHISTGTNLVVDPSGVITRLPCDDQRIGVQFRHILQGKTTVILPDGSKTKISIKDERYLSGELKNDLIGTVVVVDRNGNYFRVRTDNELYLSGELKHIACGKVTVKDDFGNTSQVDIDNDMYKSGELVHISKGTTLVVLPSGQSTRISCIEYANRNDVTHPVEGKPVVITPDGVVTRLSKTDPMFYKSKMFHTTIKPVTCPVCMLSSNVISIMKTRHFDKCNWQPIKCVDADEVFYDRPSIDLFLGRKANIKHLKNACEKAGKVYLGHTWQYL